MHVQLYPGSKASLEPWANDDLRYDLRNSSSASTHSVVTALECRNDMAASEFKGSNPVPMTPDYSFNFADFFLATFQNLVEPRNAILDGVVERWRTVPPILSRSEIEHNFLPKLLVLNQRRKVGQVYGLMALKHRLNEGP